MLKIEFPYKPLLCDTNVRKKNSQVQVLSLPRHQQKLNRYMKEERSFLICKFRSPASDTIEAEKEEIL
jgi:hypothetical protein